MGDSTELVVLWDSVVGFALLRFLFLTVVLEMALPLSGWLGGWRSPCLADSVACVVAVEVTSGLFL